MFNLPMVGSGIQPLPSFVRWEHICRRQPTRCGTRPQGNSARKASFSLRHPRGSQVCAGALQRSRSLAAAETDQSAKAMDLEILDPVAAEGGDQPDFALVLILIGDSGRKAQEYQKLGSALQGELKSRARTWVAILGSHGPSRIESDSDLLEQVECLSDNVDNLVTKLVEKGATPKPIRPQTRIRNAVLLGHGTGGIVAQELAYRGGVGFVNIAAPLRIPFPTQLFCPVMLLTGELSAGFRLSRWAAPMLDVVKTSKEFGKVKTTKRNPIVILPDSDLGGLLVEGEMMGQVCRMVGAFVALNIVPGQGNDPQLYKVLQQAMDFSVSMVAPYVKLLGRGDVSKEWANQDSFPDGVESATGVEIFSQWTLPKSTVGLEENESLATPGELAALKAFASAIQRKMLKGCLGADVVSRINVKVAALTSAKNFVYGQPTIEMLDDREAQNEPLDVGLTIRSLIHHPHLKGYPFANSTAPSYWIKFKKPSIMRLFLDPTDTKDAKEIDSDFDSKFSGKSIMEGVLEDVLALVPSHVKERYENSGVKVQFVPDCVFAFPNEWAESDWRLEFINGENLWEITCSTLKSGAIDRDGRPYPLLFASAFYMKVPSPAWLIDFVSSIQPVH